MFDSKNNLKKRLSLVLVFVFFISNIAHADALRVPMTGAQRAAELLPQAQDSQLASEGFEGIEDIAEKLEKISANVERPIVVAVNKNLGTVSWALKEDVDSLHPKWEAIGRISREGQKFHVSFLMTRRGSLGQMVIMPGVNREQIEEGLIAYLKNQSETPRIIEPKESGGIASTLGAVSLKATGL